MMHFAKHIVVYLALMLSYFGLAQSVVIPDQAFRSYLKDQHEELLDNSDKLIVSAAASFSDSLMLKGLGIQSLDGVQYFTSLKGLIAQNNALTSVPSLAALSSLQTLDVRNNQLGSLPTLSSLANLTNIYADYNQLTSLPDLSGNTKLMSLQVSHNRLQALPELSGLTKLNILEASYNNLAVLPALSGLTSLERFYVSHNKLESIPAVNLLKNLKRFDVSYNSLVQLPSLTSNTLLGEVVADSNRLVSAPNLEGLNLLKKIQLQNNLLTFDDLEPYRGRPDSAFLDYSPQINPRQVVTLTIKPGESVALAPNFTDTLDGLVYAWYKGNTLMAKSANKLYMITAAQLADSGKYYCKLTHPHFSKLTLVSDTIKLGVSDVQVGTQCPKLRPAHINTTYAQCTEPGSISISFDGKLMDSVKLVLYDAQQHTMASVSKGMYKEVKPGEYQLVITPLSAQCAFALPQKVIVEASKCYEVVLTPNSDGKDDILYFSQKGQAFIYDKQGKLLKTLQLPADWDGTNSTGILPQGYYLVKINDGAEYFNLSIIY